MQIVYNQVQILHPLLAYSHTGYESIGRQIRSSSSHLIKSISTSDYHPTADVLVKRVSSNGWRSCQATIDYYPTADALVKRLSTIIQRPTLLSSNYHPTADALDRRKPSPLFIKWQLCTAEYKFYINFCHLLSKGTNRIKSATGRPINRIRSTLHLCLLNGSRVHRSTNSTSTFAIYFRRVVRIESNQQQEDQSIEYDRRFTFVY